MKRFITCLVGIAILASLSISVVSQEETRPNPPPLEKADAKGETSPGNSELNAPEQKQPAQPSLPDAQTRIGGAPSAPPPESEAKKRNQDSERETNAIAREANEIARRDLAIQDRMAEATESLKWVGWLGLLLTGLGVFLIWQTLSATREAANYAKDAAEAAREGVEEARATTKAAQDTLRGQRAWMLFANVDVAGLPSQDDINIRTGFHFRIMFNNRGRTPAKKCLVTSKKYFIGPGNIPPPVRRPVVSAHTPADNTVGEESTSFGTSHAFSFDEIGQSMEGKKHMFIVARIDYEDVFGEKHETQCCILIQIKTSMVNLQAHELDIRQCFEFGTLGPANYAT